MGATLSYLGPQVGSAAEGFVRGRQLGTQEDAARQEMALRAAQEGRQKEAHRLNIQQTGLAIQDLQRQLEFAQQADPLRLRELQGQIRPGEQVSPDYAKLLGFEPNIGDITGREAEFAATLRARREAGRARPTGQDPRIRALADRARISEDALQRAQQSEREIGDQIADLRRQRAVSRRKEDRMALDDQIAVAESRRRKAEKERKGLAARLLRTQNELSEYLGADIFEPTPFEGEEEVNPFLVE